MNNWDSCGLYFLSFPTESQVYKGEAEYDQWGLMWPLFPFIPY
jgi:hypothetical protein